MPVVGLPNAVEVVLNALLADHFIKSWKIRSRGRQRHHIRAEAVLTRPVQLCQHEEVIGDANPRVKCAGTTRGPNNTKPG